VGAQIIFPESERGLGYATSTIFGIRSNISPKLLELQTSNLIHGFVWECRAVAQQFSLNVGVAQCKFSSMGNVTLGKRCFRWVHRCPPGDFRRREKVNGRNNVRMITESAILISAQLI